MLVHYAETIPEAQDGDAYIYRCILHDWSDGEAIRIVQSLRKAVGKSAVTVHFIEVAALLLPAQPTSNPLYAFFGCKCCLAAKPDGARMQAVIEPEFDDIVYQRGLSDVAMMAAHHASERTRAEWAALLASGGFRLTHMAPMRGAYSVMVAMPVP